MQFILVREYFGGNHLYNITVEQFIANLNN